MSKVKSVLLCGVAAALVISCTTAPSNPYHSTSRQADQPGSNPNGAPITYQNVESSVPDSFFTEGTAPSRMTSYTHQASHQVTAAPQYVYSERANTECLQSEQSRKIAGAAIGGALGAYAGKKLGGDDNETLGMIGGAVLGGTAGYGLADKSMECDPVTVAHEVHQPATVQSAGHISSPTQDYYTTSQTYAASAATTDDSLMVETGGQNLSYYSQNAVPIAATPEPVYTTIAATEQAPAQPYREMEHTFVASPTQGYGNTTTYIVQEDDTAYSLTRNLCTTPDVLKELNNLDSNFLIKAGEAILLPASQC